MYYIYRASDKSIEVNCRTVFIEKSNIPFLNIVLSRGCTKTFVPYIIERVGLCSVNTLHDVLKMNSIKKFEV